MLARALGVLLAIFAVMPVSASAQALPDGFRPSAFNGSHAPVVEGDVTSFHIEYKDCNATPFDDRGESDCSNGAVRSTMVLPFQNVMGRSIEYAFDVWIDPELEHAGFFNDQAVGAYENGIDSRLRVANWEGPLLHNFIYILKADTTNGLDFVGEQCQAPEDFGTWVRFSMKVHWTDDARGWIRVTCDDRLIYLKEQIPTNQAPHCWISNQCEPWLEKNPDRILLQLGANMAGFQGIFTEIPEGGITVKVRNVRVTDDAVLYGQAEVAAVKALQERLNALGCDVGAADGIAGAKTRQAALYCRDFGEGVLPAEFNVATLGDFLAAYQRDDAATLAVGAPPQTMIWPKAAIATSFAETGAQEASGSATFDGNFLGYVAGRSDEEIAFTLAGGVSSGRVNDLNIVLWDADLGDATPEAIRGCGLRTERLGSGEVRPAVTLKRNGTEFILANLRCARDVLPAATAERLGFVVNHLKDIAIGMGQSGQLDKVRHDDLRAFLTEVALGSITVSALDGDGATATASTAGATVATNGALLTPTFVVRPWEAISNTDADDVMVNSNVRMEVDDADFGPIEIQMRGTYAKANQNFFQLQMELAGDVGDKTSAIADCGGTTVRDGAERHLVLKFKKVDGNFRLPNGACLADAIGGEMGAQAQFLAENFADIAVGFVTEGTVEEVGNDNLRSFLRRVATGEISLAKASP